MSITITINKCRYYVCQKDYSKCLKFSNKSDYEVWKSNNGEYEGEHISYCYGTMDKFLLYMRNLNIPTIINVSEKHE